jgi:hypothetical protein
MRKQFQYAVITADIIGSSILTKDEKQILSTSLLEIFTYFTINSKEWEIKQSFEVFRGDSFQALCSNPQKALHVALIVRSFLRKYRTNDDQSDTKNSIFDARFAIGLGKVDLLGNTVGQSNGEAFQISGRTIDTMKLANYSFQIGSANEDLNKEFLVHTFVLGQYFEKLSTLQAEVIYYKLLGIKEAEIAAKLQISQPAVNQRSKAAGWEVIELIMKRYAEVVH